MRMHNMNSMPSSSVSTSDASQAHAIYCNLISRKIIRMASRMQTLCDPVCPVTEHTPQRRGGVRTTVDAWVHWKCTGGANLIQA